MVDTSGGATPGSPVSPVRLPSGGLAVRAEGAPRPRPGNRARAPGPEQCELACAGTLAWLELARDVRPRAATRGRLSGTRHRPEPHRHVDMAIERQPAIPPAAARGLAQRRSQSAGGLRLRRPELPDRAPPVPEDAAEPPR